MVSWCDFSSSLTVCDWKLFYYIFFTIFRCNGAKSAIKVQDIWVIHSATLGKINLLHSIESNKEKAYFYGLQKKIPMNKIKAVLNNKWISTSLYVHCSDDQICFHFFSVSSFFENDILAFSMRVYIVLYSSNMWCEGQCQDIYFCKDECLFFKQTKHF